MRIRGAIIQNIECQKEANKAGSEIPTYASVRVWVSYVEKDGVWYSVDGTPTNPEVNREKCVVEISYRINCPEADNYLDYPNLESKQLVELHILDPGKFYFRKGHVSQVMDNVLAIFPKIWGDFVTFDLVDTLWPSALVKQRVKAADLAVQLGYPSLETLNERVAVIL